MSDSRVLTILGVEEKASSHSAAVAPAMAAPTTGAEQRREAWIEAAQQATVVVVSPEPAPSRPTTRCGHLYNFATSPLLLYPMLNYVFSIVKFDAQVVGVSIPLALAGLHAVAGLYSVGKACAAHKKYESAKDAAGPSPSPSENAKLDELAGEKRSMCSNTVLFTASTVCDVLGCTLPTLT